MKFDNFSNTLVPVIKDAVSKVKQFVEKGNFISKFFSYPEITTRKNGFPDFYLSPFNSGPRDYRNTFNKNTQEWINVYELNGIKPLEAMINSNERLTSLYKHDLFKPIVKDLVGELGLFEILLRDIIDRYIQLKGFSETF